MRVDNRLLAIPEAASLLGVSVHGLRRLIGARAIPVVRLSPRRLRIQASDLEAYVKSHRVGATGERA